MHAKRYVSTLGAATALLALGCGGAGGDSQSKDNTAGRASIQFVGDVDQVKQTMTISAAQPGLAALSVIPTSQDGNPNTVAPNTVQVYGPTVSFGPGGGSYPAPCNAMPGVMTSNVQVFSGYAAQQLRNVYARITSISPGFAICSTDSNAELLPNSGVIAYQVVDPTVADSGRMNATSVPWAVGLPSNGSFRFVGEIQADIIPTPDMTTSPGLAPADGTQRQRTTGSLNVTFTWTEDPLADGGSGDGYTIPRPWTDAELNVYQCNAATRNTAFNPGACVATTTYSGSSVNSGVQVGLPTGFWYRWTFTPVIHFVNGDVRGATVQRSVLIYRN